MMARWRIVLAGLAAAVAVMASPAFGWGAAGHRTVAAIAMANVSPKTAAQIAVLLRAEGGLHTPECLAGTLGDASVWPDCIREDKARWGHTFAWHYQDEPLCGGFDLTLHCPHGDCITARIADARAILANRRASDTSRLMALAFLVHFVGDLHQPLHMSDHEDHGGNLVNAVIAGGAAGSLHYLWDTPLAEAAIASGPPLVRTYSADERARLGGGKIADWARESWDLARSHTYPQAYGHDICRGPAPAPGTAVRIGRLAFASDLPIVRLRLVQAGLRLARMLDGALGV